MPTIKEMQEKKGNLLHNAQKIISTAKAENRSTTAEEGKQVDDMLNEIEALDVTIEDLRRDQIISESLENLDTIESRGKVLTPAIQPSENREEGDDDDNPLSSSEYRSAFNHYAESGETRADTLVAGTTTLGGYTCPAQFVAKLLTNISQKFTLIDKCTKYNLTGHNALTIPRLTTEPDDPTITTETGTGSQTDAEFGEMKLEPIPIANRLKLSNTLIRNTAIGIESELIRVISKKFRKVMEKYLFQGTNSSQPCGIFGETTILPTTRDMAFASATELDADTLREAEADLDDEFLDDAIWVFNKAVWKKIVTLKDGDGQYLVSPSMVAKVGNELLGHPVYKSSQVPGTMTTGLYVGGLFDPNEMYVAIWQDFALQVLHELYAETNSTGYIFRGEFDCEPADQNGFVRLKMG